MARNVGYIVLLIAAAVGMSSCSSASPTLKEARKNCHFEVTFLTKAPATVHFHDETVTRTADNGYHFAGQIDSENLYGALLTTDYQCDTDAAGNADVPTITPN